MAATIGSFLRGIGIGGWDDLEPAVFAALKTRTPINLIGDKGTSKTEFCYRISRALQGKACSFQKYDTPDVSLDQILGLLNLKKMEEGEAAFVKMGTSIWDKTAVLWDEINRANPMFQGKLLEVVRTGKIHGMDSKVVFQFGTCNPPRAMSNSVGHDVYYLGDAMASRFFYIHVPQTSVALYDIALELAPVRKAFDKDDVQAIGEYCKDIATFWLEYDHATPTDQERKLATQLVRSIVGEAAKKNYFDMRAALRCTDMLAELFCLNRLIPLGQKLLIPSIQKVVCGNIVEFNGVIRNDLSSERNIIEQKLSVDAQMLLKGTMQSEEVSLISEPFKIIQRGTFAEANLQPLKTMLQRTMSKDNCETVISSLVKKLQADNKYRAITYRNGHKFALATFLTVAKDGNVKNLRITLFPGAEPKYVDIDLATTSAADASVTLHNAWYAACGLGQP